LHNDDVARWHLAPGTVARWQGLIANHLCTTRTDPQPLWVACLSKAITC